MEVLFVNTPQQAKEQENPQIINGKFHIWMVKSRMLKAGETFQQWITRTKEDYYAHHQKNIKYLFIYDIIPIGTNGGGDQWVSPSKDTESKGSMIIRYAFSGEED